MYQNDPRIVLTLDAGGTNFRFSAIQACQAIVDGIHFPSNAHQLEACLSTIEQGFQTLINRLDEAGLQASAISFAFPGPADYRRGIIMDLNNLPAFRGGVALAAFLQEKFQLPVFINNDADLFTYGECLEGALPMVNKQLTERGCKKQFKNLIGFTFGTGFGCGITHQQELFTGDNSSAGEILLLRHKHHRHLIVEEGVSIRAIKRVYHEHCNDSRSLEPSDIFQIANGTLEGDVEAAKRSFEEFGEVAADGIASAITLLDGLIVLGGGLCGAQQYFMPSLMRELNGKIETINGPSKDRLEMQVFYLDDENELNRFCQDTTLSLPVFGSQRTVDFDPIKRTGIVFSKLGTSRATSIGAYAFALNQLDKGN